MMRMQSADGGKIFQNKIHRRHGTGLAWNLQMSCSAIERLSLGCPSEKCFQTVLSQGPVFHGNLGKDILWGTVQPDDSTAAAQSGHIFFPQNNSSASGDYQIGALGEFQCSRLFQISKKSFSLMGKDIRDRAACSFLDQEISICKSAAQTFGKQLSAGVLLTLSLFSRRIS